jgi:hypothetical protein
MAMNVRRVILGGLAAGVVANLIGFFGFGLLLGPRMRAEAIAVAPALQSRSMGGYALATNIIAQFVTGLLLVWLYAALLPRFGAGLRTAVYAALVVGLCSAMFHIDWLLVGMMSARTYGLGTGLALLQVLISAAVGGRLYNENSFAKGDDRPA